MYTYFLINSSIPNKIPNGVDHMISQMPQTTEGGLQPTHHAHYLTRGYIDNEDINLL